MIKKLHIKENIEGTVDVVVDLPEEMSDAMYSVYDDVNKYEVEGFLEEFVELEPYTIEVTEQDVTLSNVPKSKAEYVRQYVIDCLNSLWEDMVENGQIYYDDIDD